VHIQFQNFSLAIYSGTFVNKGKGREKEGRREEDLCPPMLRIG
jgi:hypothetical protein